MSRSTQPVPEEPVRLVVNGDPVVAWTASPTALEPLGAGRLLALGYIVGPDDILELRALNAADSDEAGYRIETSIPASRKAAGDEERRHRARHGCGPRFLLDCRPDLGRDQGGILPGPDLEAFPDLFRELFERSATRGTTGGHHTTALVDGFRLIHLHEEVARHNGVDKAIGGGLLAGNDLSRLGLVTTARISAGMAEKAVRAGLAWVASRSVPTTLAVELAEAAAMPIVARAAGKEARVFGGEPRHG